MMIVMAKATTDILNPSVLTALASELSKTAKGMRDNLDVGDHEIRAEITLVIEGSINVAADQEYTATTSIPYKEALALLCHHAGITGPAAVKALSRAMSEALELEKLKGKDRAAKVAAIAAIADLDAAEKEVEAGLAAMPKKTRKGAVKVSVMVEVVSATADEIDVRDSDAAASTGSKVA
jgi:hypothetical protein